VTAMLGDELVSSLGQLPEEWIADAIKETGRSGARSWKYTNAILDRWKLEGREQSPVVDATEKFRNSRVLEAANKWKAATQ
jgi:DNA replication protein DnaD